MPMGGGLHNLASSFIHEIILVEFPEVIRISYHDNDFLFGESAMVLTATKRLEELRKTHCDQKLNLSLSLAWCQQGYSAATTENAAELNIVLLNKDEGMEVCGSFVGTDIATKHFFEEVVSDICALLDNIVKVSALESSVQDHTLQSLTMMISLCVPSKLVYLARTLQPSLIIDAARKFDKHLFRATIQMNKCLQKFIDLQNSPIDANKRSAIQIFKKFFLKISNGGMGIQSLSATCEHAYIASMAICLSHIPKIVPEFKAGSEMLNTTAITELRSLLVKFGSLPEYKELLSDITIEGLLETPLPGMQKLLKIIQQSNLSNEIDADNPTPTGSFQARNGTWIEVYTPEGRQTIRKNQSEKGPETGAWMSIFPGKNSWGKLPNISFITAWQARIGFDLSSSSHCPCGAHFDPHLGHTFSCRCVSIRGTPATNRHTGMQKALVEIITDAISDTHYITTDPKVSEDFIQRTDKPVVKKRKSKSKPKHPFEEAKIKNNAHIEIGDVNYRGDIKIVEKISGANRGEENNNKIDLLIIDLTFTHPAGQAHQSYAKPGSAAETAAKDKLDKYKNNFEFPESKFLAFAGETYGALSTSSQKFIRQLAQMKAETSGREYPQIVQSYFQRLSVAFQLARVNQIQATIKNFSISNKFGHPNGDHSLDNDANAEQIQQFISENVRKKKDKKTTASPPQQSQTSTAADSGGVPPPHDNAV